ncbi:LysR family transcriptional regulator [Jannaschia sp. CCS1]|uniref:LysR family transcriptional regulator n=1 Tax=Jannaschia sp. (strain CCS1) TaxID=290400 RepID=UPI000053C792|nr:LysR family transcriptional regulator [Jannaschia sp. CCS1]ABD56661.1 transcriptional regulator, LysR family [Jannaschia sp. CCS1]
MNRLAEIECFIAVVDAGSQLAASKTMNIAVSAIHRRIKDLEARLGVTLTRRTSHGTALTPEGRAYYQRCVSVVADLNEADARATGELHKASGLIRMTVPIAFGTRHLAPIMTSFSAEHPDIRFELNISDHHVDLLEDGYDLAIRIGGDQKPQLGAVELFKVQYALTASPAFWETHGLPQSPEDLVGLPTLVYRAGAVPSYWPFRNKAGEVSKIPIQPRYIANNGEFLVEAAKAGLGVSLEPTFVCGEALQAGKLVAALTEYDTFDRAAQIVTPANRPLSFRVREFLGVLQTELSQPGRWNVVQT